MHENSIDLLFPLRVIKTKQISSLSFANIKISFIKSIAFSMISRFFGSLPNSVSTNLTAAYFTCKIEDVFVGILNEHIGKLF